MEKSNIQSVATVNLFNEIESIDENGIIKYKQNDFYNTNGLKGESLVIAKQTAKSQQVLILETFKKYPDKELTPSEIFTMIDDYNTLLTSVRRAITNLERSGKLIKTQNTKPGLYGSPNFCWKLKI